MLSLALQAEEGDSKAPEMTREEQIERARDVTQSRILTQEEFKQVRKRQLQKLVQLDPKAHRKGKRKAESDKVCIDDVDAQRYTHN